jgi:hypothetical protein
MNSPCYTCLVKPVCKYYCEPWFYWIDRYSILPLDKNIRIDAFLELVGNFGPIRNYYQNEYSALSKIKFQKTYIEKVFRVSLTID